MKKSFVYQVIICLFMFVGCLGVSAQNSQKSRVGQNPEQWIKSMFAKGKVPPLSFVYDGKNSVTFITKWNYSFRKEKSDDANVLKYCVSYVDGVSGLRVDCHLCGYMDFGAVEWVLNFTNTSSQNSPIIEDVKVADYNISSVQGDGFVLHYAAGNNAERSDFMPKVAVLKVGEPLFFVPEGGRSSDHAFPFFNLEMPNGQGIVMSIGWSGTWFAKFLRTADQSASFSSGMDAMKLFLYPGESIRTPRVSMLFWKGSDSMAGNNKFRHFVLAHHTRKIDGKFAQYPLCGGFDWGDPAPCNEYSCLTEDYAISIVRRHKQFGIVPEVFWLDAGWYTGCGGPDFTGGDWASNVGNWTVDKTRFPRGLKPISDEAHKIGAKFMVWFEPERVIAGTQFAREHPEWMLRIPDNDTYLFDLGNKDACAWLSKYIGDMLDENGIDYYRQDFNMSPALYWKVNDEPGRSGMREIRHIEGLYAFWDYLLKRFPNLMIDNCASGGRRIDLETTDRSAPLWRTDYSFGEPNGYQCHTYGLNFFLPLHGTGVYQTDPYSFRSSMCSAMVFNWEINSQRVTVLGMQKSIADFKELRPYYYEDYYPLTGIGDLTGDDVWLAYQLNKPSDDSGIVMCFRRKDNKNDKLTVSLQGLKSEMIYTVTNDNDGSFITKTGKELADGFTMNINEAPGSIMIRYKGGNN